MPQTRRVRRPAPVSAAPAATPPPVVAATPAQAVPLAETVQTWVCERLQHRGYPLPVQKRIAWLVTGLIAGDHATRAGLAETLAGLAITPAKEESIARRLLRIVDDARLDPERLLPELLADLVPVLLHEQVAAHDANVGAGAYHHRRFPPLRIVLDETSQDERVHVLTAGLAYRGIVLPLAVRVWEQNVAVAPGEYWCQVTSLLTDVQRLLPAVLRDHVVLLADRAYGVPRLLDLLHVLGWGWLLRMQDQTLVQFPEGTTCAVRTLVPTPGTVWCNGVTPLDLLAEPATAEAGTAPATVPPLALFKKAGWRHSHVVAAWAVGAAEPWLLLTSLPPTRACLRDYAQRWTIERLFLCWKSHGWDLEAVGVQTPARLGRLLAGLVVATLWRIALAVPVTADHLAELQRRAAIQAQQPRQLPLPLDLPGARPAPSSQPARLWPAKFSLFTWSTKVIHATACRTHSPRLCWALPDWLAPVWSQQCRACSDLGA